MRDGRVEESERSEGDDVGLRVLVGKRQAVVSTNDVGGDGVARLAERAVAMARVAPDDDYVGLADPSLLARDFPDLDLLDPDVPTTAELERRASEAEAAALAVKGVAKSGGASASTGIGGMVLVTSTGFHGAYLRSSQGISMTAISGEGTGMERDYDFTAAPHAADLVTAGERRPHRRRAHGRARQSAQGRNLQGAGRVRPARVGLAGRPSGRRDQRRLDRAQDQLSQRPPRRTTVRQATSASSTIPCAGAACARSRSTPRASRSRSSRMIDEGVLTTWLLDCATARELELATTGHAHRGVSSSPSPGPYNLHLEAGEPTPSRTDLRHPAGLLCHRPDRLGRQRRHRRLQPRRIGLLDRERRDHLSGERGDDRGSSARHLQVAGRRPTIWNFVMASTRRRCVSRD